MPTLTFPIQPDGLVVDVLIGPERKQILALQARGQSIPRPVVVRGVMDTAADVTAVAPRVLQALGLTSTRSVRTYTAGGSIQVGLYEISLSILPATGSTPLFTAPCLFVTELVHAAPGIEVLVGLDVLLQGVLNVDGPAGIFSFSF
jgi:hypothetical protein